MSKKNRTHLLEPRYIVQQSLDIGKGRSTDENSQTIKSIIMDVLMLIPFSMNIHVRIRFHLGRLNFNF